MIAQVAVSCAIFAIDQPYSYRIPQGMQILPGMRVVVPFGRANRRTEAIVLGVQTGSEDKLKAIEQLLDDEPVMTDEQLRLAAFVDLLVLLILALSMAVKFKAVKPLAGYLQIPYILWLTFAGYLNLSAYLLNG